jgi:glutamine synthetase
VFLAEYIWLDGSDPEPLLRSKTKVCQDKKDIAEWIFDGSSTKQASSSNSECTLRPVCIVPDPIRGDDNKLVLCEVLNSAGSPHTSNTRHLCEEVNIAYAEDGVWFGLEQEYVLSSEGKPLGFPAHGYPPPQGDYYCGVGSMRVFGRQIAETHLEACLYAGLAISGINAEVMPGQWEFQIGPTDAITVSDHLWLARYLLVRIAEDFNVEIDFKPKPVPGDWNGSGCHANYSNKRMRQSFDECIKACERLSLRHTEMVVSYGSDIGKRLTGLHETCHLSEFRWGVADRTASVRIPAHVAAAERGYIEDRRPNANCDPYVVTRLLITTIQA